MKLCVCVCVVSVIILLDLFLADEHPEWITPIILLALPPLGPSLGTCNLLPEGLPVINSLAPASVEQLLKSIGDSKVANPTAKAKSMPKQKAKGKKGKQALCK